MASNNRAIDLLPLGLASAALLVAEITLADRVNWYCEDQQSAIAIPLVLVAAALGKVAAVHRIFAAVRAEHALLGAAALTTLAASGLARTSGIDALWVLPPIAAFGLYLSRIYAELPLGTVVWGLGMGAVSAMASLHALYELVGGAMALFASVLAALAAMLTRRGRATIVAGIVLIATSTAVELAGGTEGPLSAERHLESLKGSERLAPSHYGPLIRTDVVGAGRIRSRYLITNGSRHAIVARMRDLEVMPTRLATEAPYLLRASPPENVLVMGSGGGKNVVAALRHDAGRVVAVDINPQVFALMRGPLRDFTGDIYGQPNVVPVVSEGRHYLETTDESFDVISIQGVQSGTVPGGGSVVEAHLFTREAIRAAWSRVRAGGQLFYDDYRRLPGRVSLLEHVAAMARDELGVDEAHTLFYRYQIRSRVEGLRSLWREGLVLSRAPFTSEGRAQIEQLVGRDRGRMAEPPSDVRTIDDDRPFYLERATPSLIRALSPQLAALVLAVFGVVCVLSLAIGRRRRKPHARMLWLGAGFILLIQGVVGPAGLLLGSPDLRTPVVFGTVYLGTLIGGVFALRATQRVALLALIAASITCIVGPFAWREAQGILQIPSIALRAAIVSAWLVPLASWTEVPYVALLREAEGRPRAVLYAWGAGGAAVAIALGLYLQSALGFSFVLGAAGVVYAAVAAASWRTDVA